jgi:hypothetical protein
MTARIGNVAFDCVDVLSTAGFWSKVLGRPLDEGSSGEFATIGGADGGRAEPAWYFNKVSETKRATLSGVLVWLMRDSMKGADAGFEALNRALTQALHRAQTLPRLRVQDRQGSWWSCR